MKKLIFILFLICVFAVPSAMVSAQSTPSVIDTTIPVDDDVKDAVNAWLATSAPVPLPYWAITYVRDDSTGVFVSLVALNIRYPTDKWHVTDDSVVSWMGSVIIHADNSIELYSDGGYEEQQQARGPKVLASLSLAPGGGANIRFPWEFGKTMMYGTRGVHAAGSSGYATGFLAVDFLGGDDLGSGVADNSVYAVAPGTVDYVCEDETTTLIRTTNEATDDSFIYAHLLGNASLVDEHVFAQNALIGVTKYGTFDDNCGWAEQTPKHYHLHFGFKPSAGGAFRMEGCILNTTDEKWTCGTKVVSTGQWLQGGGGNYAISSTGEDAGISTEQPNFWDYMIVGGVQLFQQNIVENLPEHTANQFAYAMINGISVAVRITRVLVYSNLNLEHLIAIIMFGMGIKLAFGIAEFVVFLFKAWKSLVPIIGA